MDERFIKTINDALAASRTLEGIIISGPNGEYAFEKEKGRAINWVNNSPRFKKQPDFSNQTLFRPLQIPGLRNVSIQAVARRNGDSNPGATGASLGAGPNKESVFSATHITTDNLRLREAQSLSSPTITVLGKGTKTIIKEWGNSVTVDGKSARWAYVYTIDGFEGWCYSGYLEKIK